MKNADFSCMDHRPEVPLVPRYFGKCRLQLYGSAPGGLSHTPGFQKMPISVVSTAPKGQIYT